jgi:hypothetical protein
METGGLHGFDFANTGDEPQHNADDTATPGEALDVAIDLRPMKQT